MIIDVQPTLTDLRRDKAVHISWAALSIFGQSIKREGQIHSSYLDAQYLVVLFLVLTLPAYFRCPSFRSVFWTLTTLFPTVVAIRIQIAATHLDSSLQVYGSSPKQFTTRVRVTRDCSNKVHL